MATAASPRAAPDRRSWRYRVNIAVRGLAGTLGAYAVAALFGAALARTLPIDRADAAIVGTLLALLAAPAVTIWAFLARGPWLACAGVVALAALLGAIGWLAGQPI